MTTHKLPKGKLYLLPAPLGEGGETAIPDYAVAQMRQLTFFVVERSKTARRWLKFLQHPTPQNQLHVEELNDQTPPSEWQNFLAPAENGNDIGLLSEAGCPAIADPGAELVRLAHEKGIEVVPLVGPSSILLALMASGMNGQRFCFHGYLPVKPPELAAALRDLEQQSQQMKQTQIFIETPYRNNSFVETALKTLSPNTRFCIAADLTLPTEYIVSGTVQSFKNKTLQELHKRPAIFLLLKS